MAIKGSFEPTLSAIASVPSIWSPVIRVSLSDSTDQAVPNIIAKDLIAMIDTGSSYCSIDQELINTHHLRIAGHGNTTTANGVAAVNVYSVQIILEDGHVLPMNCLNVQLRNLGQNCDLLFGMDAIRHFSLLVNRYPPEVTLTWVG